MSYWTILMLLSLFPIPALEARALVAEKTRRVE